MSSDELQTAIMQPDGGEGLIETPATIPGVDGEWTITLNGYVLRESDLRKPVHDLPIEGKVTGDGKIGENSASVEVVFSEDGVETVMVTELLEDCGWTPMEYDLTPADDQPESGERWTTWGGDREATVEILPPEEVSI